VIVYFTREIKSLKAEMKAKSLAHAEQIKEKDNKIQELNDKIHTLGIEAITSVKEFTNHAKEWFKS
jgi:hypothetical protein